VIPKIKTHSIWGFIFGGKKKNVCGHCRNHRNPILDGKTELFAKKFIVISMSKVTPSTYNIATKLNYINLKETTPLSFGKNNFEAKVYKMPSSLYSQ